jgi:hypothetical protein
MIRVIRSPIPRTVFSVIHFDAAGVCVEIVSCLTEREIMVGMAWSEVARLTGEALKGGKQG